MKKTSQSVYPLPDISSKPQPALDRVESKNGQFSNLNSILKYFPPWKFNDENLKTPET